MIFGIGGPELRFESKIIPLPFASSYTSLPLCSCSRIKIQKSHPPGSRTKREGKSSPELQEQNPSTKPPTRLEHKEWLSGVEFLGVVEHPNLVKILGYCLVDDEKERQSQRLLVYEYMPNKSLDYHLFNTTLPPIPWMKRLQILLGAAQGLAYLHQGLETQVLFGDFNSGDVLLDENFNPKLSEFGLERGQVRNLSYVRTVSFYASPEYVHCGHLKSNSDSWSFGIVLYEILSGRRVIDRNLPHSQQMLTKWVKQFPADSKIFCMMMDPRLDNQYSLSGARKVAKLADSCMRNNPEDRPTMSEIVDVLQESIRDSEDESQNPLPESST
ncbi:unnamed protein product [Lactuca virosa]|uniref:Protein kinase domain-containing protein n=1 Tax=Lactuca virosa TaxID=75947 RepID=A0AAU9PW29_9ASTR|nr:unnamed protein product [Lactuca virosa]